MDLYAIDGFRKSIEGVPEMGVPNNDQQWMFFYFMENLKWMMTGGLPQWPNDLTPVWIFWA